MPTMTHTTIDGERYGLDADGRVLAPDADGRADALDIGKVEKLDILPRATWRATPRDGATSEHATRGDAIRALVAVPGACPSSPIARVVRTLPVTVTIDGESVTIDGEDARGIFASAILRLGEQARTFPRDGAHATRDHLYRLVGESSRAHAHISHALTRRGYAH